MKKSRTILLILAVMLGISDVSQAQTPPPGLIATYSFDEGSGLSANDGSGNAHTGVISGATWTIAGKYGSALSFNGTNSWVTVADANDLDLTTGLTLEAWVFPTAAATATTWRNVLIKERSGGEIYNLYADTDTHVPAAYVVRSANPGTPVGVNGVAQVPLNTWTHLAMTYDTATVRLYVNGTLVRSSATTGALLTSTGALRIGGNSVWGEFFQGMIDEVRVYNRALTQAEIQTDMATPVTGATLVTRSPNNTAIDTGSLRGGTAASLSADDNSYYQINSTTAGTRTTSWYAVFTGVPRMLSNLQVTYKGKNSQSCTQTIAIWHWPDNSWVPLDSRAVGTTEIAIANLTPAGTLSEYVSGTTGNGDLRVQVRCTRNAGNFFASGDLVEIVYETP
jgi:Concanavalin A-like lectin/glucanases superfamily